MYTQFIPSIRYIYFDFDNVLVERTVKRSAVLANIFGLENSRDIRDFYINEYKAIPNLLEMYNTINDLKSENEFYVSLFKYFLTTTGIKFTNKQIIDAVEDFINTPFRVRAGVKDKLKVLHGDYKLGILSNGLPSRHNEITRCDIESHFSNIIISCDYGIEKPDPRIYEIASDKANTSPEHIALVDDSVNNIDGAQLAGFGQTILYTDSFWH